MLCHRAGTVSTAGNGGGASITRCSSCEMSQTANTLSDNSSGPAAIGSSSTPVPIGGPMGARTFTRILLRAGPDVPPPLWVLAPGETVTILRTVRAGATAVISGWFATSATPGSLTGKSRRVHSRSPMAC